jgi:SIR2-like domain
VEPPYGGIWNRIKAGKVVPFLGAGASMAGRPGNATWDPDRPQFLPSGADLAQFLADEANFPKADDPRDPGYHDRRDLAKVSSYYADTVGRGPLRERLRDVLLRPDYQPGPLHQFLAAVPSPQVIVSTNYDTLLEQAFQAAGKPYDLVVYVSDGDELAESVLWWRHGATDPTHVHAADLDIDLATTSVIYKMHGTVITRLSDFDSFVITEDDYVNYLAQIDSAVPAVLATHFSRRSFLFLGYSLRDWNLRVILKNLSKPFATRAAQRGRAEEQLPSWAILRKPSPVEQVLWSKRLVQIFDVDLDEFVTNIGRRMGGG